MSRPSPADKRCRHLLFSQSVRLLESCAQHECNSDGESGSTQCFCWNGTIALEIWTRA